MRLLLTLALSLLLSTICLSAPAPTPKSVKPNQIRIPTQCDMIWGSTRYYTYFGSDSYYQATDANDHRHMWTGTWELKTEGDEKILIIKETHISANSSLLTWRIILSKDMRTGKFSPGGGSFRIEQ